MTTNEKKINKQLLTNKINNLHDDAFKTIYNIIQKNNETYDKTKNYYLVNLDTVSNKTLVELHEYIQYLDDTFNELTNNEIEMDKLKKKINQN